MPGCPAFIFFPRFKAYTQVNTMMWDFRGAEAFQDRPMPPPPRFPVPSPGHPTRPMTERSRSDYPAPFAPLGLPTPPGPSAPRMPSPNHQPYTRVVPPPPPPRPAGSLPSRVVPRPPPAPMPRAFDPVPSVPTQPRAHHARSHSHQESSSRHVHYSASTQRLRPPPVQPVRQRHSSSPPSSQQIRGVSSSQQLRPPAAQRVRVNSGGARPNLAQPGPSQAQHVHNGIHFQYSKCTGRKKALCIGINYKGQNRELRGCLNDVRNVKKFLTSYWGYRDGDIVMLVDETENPRQMPTRKNILDGMRWLVKDAKPHDSLFFHYSGHGGQIPDQDGDEVDGFDEVIYPVDYKKSGIIVDDEMHRIMVKSLPMGCRLTAVFDSCHSGTALDLPYIYHSNGRLKGSHISPSARAAKATSADVISFAACRDDQTSADTVQGGVAVGAMSYAFVTALVRKPSQTYQELLRSIRDILRDRYKQKPQLSSSHPIDTNLRFIL
ncbi:caspase domain-containing protein [Hygrophoropsis aurantiaca]|uniref:Caspase domain-containing protein n=1 Tax=Hygrophoropsis aurantiaca TaxID=72124 RepID=A0ACB7ZV11_9AGAM|nr:caspase domain-containing protein [Hygrophoropsis aurantiaca]